jgi:triosephosphate isomerase (TIM)
VALARELERAGRAAGVAVAIAPPTPQLASVASAVHLPVLAQHVDPDAAGPSTGFVPVRTLAAAGARGSLVNHSEHPISFDAVRSVVPALKAAGLAAVVCAPTPRAVARLARARPPYLAIEPPELIGGRRAVSTARPAVIVEAVRAVRAVAPATRVLCGAGVHAREDVRRALELGSDGILVASAVALAPRPRRVLDDLLRGFG